MHAVARTQVRRALAVQVNVCRGAGEPTILQGPRGNARARLTPAIGADSESVQLHARSRPRRERTSRYKTRYTIRDD